MSKQWWDRTLVHGKRGHEMRVMDADGAGDPLRERHVALVYTPSRHDGDGILTWDDADRAAEEMARGLAAAPDMARALKAFLASGLNARWVDDETGNVVNVRKMAEAALAKAGGLLP